MTHTLQGILPGPGTFQVDTKNRSVEIILWLISVIIMVATCTQLYHKGFPETTVGECRVITLKGECTMYMINTLYSTHIDCSTIVNELTLSGHYTCNYTNDLLGIGYYKSNIAILFMISVMILVVLFFVGVNLYIIN